MLSWLVVGWFFGFTYTPLYALEIQDTFVEHKHTFSQTLGLELRIIDVIRLYTDIEIYDVPLEIWSWSPYRADFTIGLEVRYKNFTLGARHECNHDVIADHSGPRNGYQMGITQFYMEIRGSTGKT